MYWEMQIIIMSQDTEMEYLALTETPFTVKAILLLTDLLLLLYSFILFIQISIKCSRLLIKFRIVNKIKIIISTISIEYLDC